MATTSYKLPLYTTGVCKCSACGEFFSGLQAFDAHRVQAGQGKECKIRHEANESGYLHEFMHTPLGTYWAWTKRAYQEVSNA